jgi:5-methylcytosine-specific restriction endonuclease McrA
MYIRKCKYCEENYPATKMLVVHFNSIPESVCEKCYRKEFGYDKRLSTFLREFKKKCAKCGKTYPLTEAYFHWYKDNPNSYCRKCSGNVAQNARNKRRARKMDVANPCTYREWTSSLRNFNYECAYCGEKGRLWQDHIVALSKGGKHIKNNIVPCCKRCNTKKSTYDMETWYTQQEWFNQEKLDKIKQWQQINKLVEV